jgi:hypothetical protein
MRLIIFFFLFIFSVVAFGQSNTDKNTVSKTDIGTVEIKTAAVPADGTSNYSLVSTDYHKAVEIGHASTSSTESVEMTVSAVKNDGQVLNNVEKKAVPVLNTRSQQNSVKAEKTVDVTVAASPR